MNCEAYIRLIPDADTAVMFIHGIAGSPRHYDDLLPMVERVPAGWSVVNLLLPGHGGTVGDFGRSSMDEWRGEVEKVFLNLCKAHQKILLVGHSMGALFSIQLGCQYPEKITGIFLLAVPFRPRMALSGAVRMIRLTFGRLHEDNDADMALLRACGVEPTWLIWKYIGWIPRFLELFAEMGRTASMTDMLQIPTIAFQSGRDELVRRSSGRILESNPVIQVKWLPKSGHFYYTQEDKTKIMKTFEAWLHR